MKQISLKCQVLLKAIITTSSSATVRRTINIITGYRKRIPSENINKIFNYNYFQIVTLKMKLYIIEGMHISVVLTRKATKNSNPPTIYPARVSPV